jgi:hypothetical protein
VARNHGRNPVLAILGNLGWPLLLGLAAWVGFYALLKQGLLGGDWLVRYFAGHWVEYAEAALFFIGLAALAIKALGVVGQHAVVGRVSLGPAPAGGQPAEDAEGMLGGLSELPPIASGSYLARRLRDALEFVHRKGSAEGLDDELKYLSESDAVGAQESNALVTLVIWATPMLGFLGTVIGITMALGDLSPQVLVEKPQEAMKGLLAGLAVAFDTTALALTLSMVLMFVKFGVDQFETQLLSIVDRRAAEELVGRFRAYGADLDPQLAPVRHMAETVIRSSETLVRRQTELWQATIDAAHQQWTTLMDSAGGRWQSALGGAIEQSLEAHAARLADTETAAAERAAAFWERLEHTLSESARRLHAQQSELAKQGELLLKVVEATGEVTRLEHALNDNLRSLAGAKNFEATVMSLAAAIHLLTARLENGPQGIPQIELAAVAKSQGRAA